IFAGLAWFFGTNIFGTPTTVTNWESLLRTLGYAQAPNVLAIFGIIPLIGWIPALIGSIWAIVTAVVAIRETLDFSTGRAVITAIVAWIATAIVAIILGLLFNVTIVF
ncbi:MAG: YIP1 family protein, partial [Chloroflexia bacterium]|nr:YIP1 family protein [Chloroflexia bacterium]